MQRLRGQAATLVKETTGDGSFTDVNYIIPTFILTQLPIGLVGLLIVAILMAATDTIAGELNSLATATVMDFYKRWFRTDRARRPLPGDLPRGDRLLGAVCLRRRCLGGRARLVDRGRQPLRVVLLWIDSRGVHSRHRFPLGDRQRRLHRARRRHGLGRVVCELHQGGIPVA